ncbi:hypothetical protein [Streptomyces sp. NPDC042319]|uniref:hypothetical protein n=1 Tax=Streptomyces sp. NPDC042319 TaxID=3154332 RepID=UPI0033F07381
MRHPLACSSCSSPSAHRPRTALLAACALLMAGAGTATALSPLASAAAPAAARVDNSYAGAKGHVNPER